MVNFPPDYCPYCGGELEPIQAGDDAAEARFWTRPEFETADQNGYLQQVDNVTRLLRAARDALDRADRS